MKRTVAGFVLTVGLSSSAYADDSEGYSIRSVSTDQPSAGLVRTKFTIREGTNALNTFDVVRVRESGRVRVAEPPVILLSPFGFQSEFWELSTESYADSFVARVAADGHDVWLVDNRTAALAPGSCESGAVDCAPLADWGIDTGVRDALFVRELVRTFHPGRRPILGGLSGGSSAAIATIDRAPHKFSGLFMWEGTIYTADPVIRARNAAFCADDIDALAAGQFVDPAVQGFKLIFDLANAAPNDPSPVPGFPPGTTNLQALVFAFAVPNPANPLNFTDGFIRLIGDPSVPSFTYADMDRVLAWGPLVGTYAPVRFLRDSHCEMGGVEDQYSDNLDAFRGEVLVYAEGYGFGQMMLDTAALMTHAHVTVDQHAEFGESDRYFNTDWVSVAVDPLLDWLNTRF